MPSLKHPDHPDRLGIWTACSWLSNDDAEKGVVSEDAAEDLGKSIPSAEQDLFWKPWGN